MTTTVTYNLQTDFPSLTGKLLNHLLVKVINDDNTVVPICTRIDTYYDDVYIFFDSDVSSYISALTAIVNAYDNPVVFDGTGKYQISNGNASVTTTGTSMVKLTNVSINDSANFSNSDGEVIINSDSLHTVFCQATFDINGKKDTKSITRVYLEKYNNSQYNSISGAEAYFTINNDGSSGTISLSTPPIIITAVAGDKIRCNVTLSGKNSTLTVLPISTVMTVVKEE